MKPETLERVVICGMGVMGASLGHTLVQKRLAARVVALVRRPAIIPELLELGVADEATCSPQEAVSGADLVVIATPVGVILDQLQVLAPHLHSQTLVTDVGSVKQAIVLPAGKILEKRAVFVGSHPMAGTEKFGFQNFIKGLYQGMPCILTPTGETPEASLGKLRSFWESVGTEITVMSPAEHDQAVGFISHLPHVLAGTLMRCLMDQKRENPFLFDLAGGSFRDMTRIAASSPEIWADIFLGNREAVLKTVAAFRENLDGFKSQIETRDRQGILRFLEEVSNARQACRPRAAAGDS